jgi:hypothetical protein
MNIEPVEKIANAVLYEGYLLYPYRADSTKNRQRWNFGTLHPKANGAETGPASFHSEVLMEGNEQTSLEARVRFLQFIEPEQQDTATWNEAVERAIDVPETTIGRLRDGLQQSFIFLAGDMTEDGNSPRVQEIQGTVQLSASAIVRDIFRITLELTNISACISVTQPKVLLQSLGSAHAVLQVQNGSFVSLLDPSSELLEAAAQCSNRGVFPVLCGEAPGSDTMLVSPIILYDYPQIAPESSGDFFDGTEIDEMLMLRVMTLSDDEKLQMAAGDPRGRMILERVSDIGEEQLMKVHGAVRGLRRASGQWQR